MNKLIEDVIKFIAPPEHIKIGVQEDLPIVTGEALKIFQVFQNLLDNAIKYNDKDIGIIKISGIEEKKCWRFTVEDNGPGIPKHYQDKIFQLFQTLLPKDQTDSTGIGLSLIQKIVDNWGGKIWLESELGQGCKFIFTLQKQ